MGTSAPSCHCWPAPLLGLHGGGSATVAVVRISTSPSIETCTQPIWAPVPIIDQAAARQATSTRSARSPASIARRRRSVAITSGRGSGTRCRGWRRRNRCRRRTPTSARMPAASSAACSSRIGDGASGDVVAGPPGALVPPPIGTTVVVVAAVVSAVSGVVEADSSGVSGSGPVDAASGAVDRAFTLESMVESMVESPVASGAVSVALSAPRSGATSGAMAGTVSARTSGSTRCPGSGTTDGSSPSSRSQPGRIRSGSSKVLPPPMSPPALRFQMSVHRIGSPSCSSAMSQSVSPRCTS